MDTGRFTRFLHSFGIDDQNMNSSSAFDIRAVGYLALLSKHIVKAHGFEEMFANSTSVAFRLARWSLLSQRLI